MTTLTRSNDCSICAHALVHGSWPTDHRGTHCMECHRSWTSKVQSHCTVCHRHFGSDTAGDAHRRGDYRHGKTPVCQDPEGFPRWETPNGPVYGGRDPVKQGNRLQAALRGSRGRAENDENVSS